MGRMRRKNEEDNHLFRAEFDEFERIPRAFIQWPSISVEDPWREDRIEIESYSLKQAPSKYRNAL